VQINSATETAEELRQAFRADRHAIPFHSGIRLGVREFDLHQVWIKPGGDHVALLCEVKPDRCLGVCGGIFDLQAREGLVGSLRQERPSQQVFGGCEAVFDPVNRTLAD
jgi:hypothetical protein